MDHGLDVASGLAQLSEAMGLAGQRHPRPMGLSEEF